MSAFTGDIWCSDMGRKPTWQVYLEDASESVIRQTGLSRKELKEVLMILHEHRIIN